MKKLKTLTLAFVLLLVSAVMVGCGKEFKLSATDNKTSLKPGESVQLVTDAKDEDKEYLTYHVVENAEMAEVTATGLLTVKDTATVGSVVKAVVKYKKEVASNTLSITVLPIPATSITVSANKTNIEPDSYANLSYVVNPTNTTESVSWQITQGENLATIENNKLYVNANATLGSVIKVKAVAGNVSSEELSFTVGNLVPLVSLTASASVTEITPGQSATLNVVKNPTNTTDSVVWEVVEGQALCSVEGNALIVKAEATSGSKIKVKATNGKTGNEKVESNVLEFTVGLSNAEKFHILTTADMTVDSGNTQASKVLTATVLNAEFQQVSGKNVSFEVVEGSEYVQISSNGYNCTITAVGHGTAKIRTTLKNDEGTMTIATSDTVVTSIKAPEQILVPEVLRNKTNINFATSKNYELDFVAEIKGTNVCQEVEYVFSKFDGEKYVVQTANEVAKYENGKITFYTTGKIKVTVNSLSGSVKSVFAEQVFNVNEGINVSTFEELQSTLNSATYTGQIVNIVNFTKDQTYGYDLVPEYILNDTQTTQKHLDTKIYVQHGDLRLNGNGYKINLSGMKYIETNDNYGSFIDIGGAAVAGNTKADHFVEIVDLKLESNTSIQGSVGSQAFAQTMINNKGVLHGAFRRAINIGGDDTLVSYGLNINNVEITKFQVGMRFSHIIDGIVSNSRVENIFVNGIESCASIITFHNMKYGVCGAAGIEITPDSCATAGLNFNENQAIKFSGYIESTNQSAGDTVYFQLYGSTIGTTIPTVLKGSLQLIGANEVQSSNIVKIENNQEMFNIVALMFNGNSGNTTNTSTLSYLDISGGIINITETSSTEPDTEHQYIILPLAQNFGYVIAYNPNYIAD